MEEKAKKPSGYGGKRRNAGRRKKQTPPEYRRVSFYVRKGLASMLRQVLALEAGAEPSDVDVDDLVRRISSAALEAYAKRKSEEYLSEGVIISDPEDDGKPLIF